MWNWSLRTGTTTDKACRSIYVIAVAANAMPIISQRNREAPDFISILPVTCAHHPPDPSSKRRGVGTQIPLLGKEGQGWLL
jgi:hypothetical protein